MAKRSNIGHGVYQDSVTGVYYVRPWINGKRTWRKLDAVKERYAIEEARAKFTDHKRAKSGMVKSPFATTGLFQMISDAYAAASCPNKRLEPRPGEFTEGEKLRLAHLNAFFGKMPIDSIRIPNLTQYATWRRARLTKKKATGNRSIDLDMVTLSNVLSYAVSIGELDRNQIATGRPKFQTADLISRSRERAIQSGDEIHKLADHFFSTRPKTEVTGWLTIFSALTGCRQVELLSLRMDGTGPETPGWISGNYLFLRRAKRGIHPWIELKGPIADAVERFRYWHELRYPPNSRHASPLWFPGQAKHSPMTEGSLAAALVRACKTLGLPRCSPHGFRSFYVTLRRSEGASDVQIASEIGDKTVSVISESYGDVPPNWKGQNQLSFLPAEGLPAWERWKPREEKIVSL